MRSDLEERHAGSAATGGQGRQNAKKGQEGKRGRGREGGMKGWCNENPITVSTKMSSEAPIDSGLQLGRSPKCAERPTDGDHFRLEALNSHLVEVSTPGCIIADKKRLS